MAGDACIDQCGLTQVPPALFQCLTAHFDILWCCVQSANPFGTPFLLQIEDDETLADVQPRIKVLLCRLPQHACPTLGMCLLQACGLFAMEQPCAAVCLTWADIILWHASRNLT